jgi:signal transduction histidine kinase
LSSRIFAPRSLRWRLQLWLAFLLVCVLAGFGVTVYQLQRVNRFNQIDGELAARISSLNGALREMYLKQAAEVEKAAPPEPRLPPREAGQSKGRPSGDKGFGGPPHGGFGPDGRGFGGRGEPPDGGRGFDGRGFDGRGFDEPGRGRGFGEPDGRGRDFEGRGFQRGGRRDPPPDRPKHFEKQARPAPQPKKPESLDLPAATAALFGDRPDDYYFVVWYRDGSVLKRSGGAPAELARPEAAERDTLPHFRTRNGFREELYCSGLADCLLTGRSVAADLQASRNFGWTLLAAGGAVLALALALGFWFTGRAIRPIENISAAASRISHGNLSERVEGADSGDELGNLAGVLNSTFSRLEAAFERQRQFTADAAHELRTPLAVIISEAQTTLARERPAAEYRETVEACLETAQQMRRLTESLLELARFDAAGNPARVDFDMADIARLAMERVRPLAERHGIALESALEKAPAHANAERIGQVMANLLTNAIYYNKARGTVRIETKSVEGRATITVSDTGIGIAAADIDHIFERFYRVDKARSRAEGHTGLGLAISKAIVEAEGGSIEVASESGVGTTFTVRI